MDKELKEIFSENSTSYYYSSLVFPEKVRKKVFKLYAYVRTADDFVDDKPQNSEALRDFRRKTFENWDSGESDDRIVNVFLEVAREDNFEKIWVESFLDSMAADLDKSSYQTMDETLDYIDGSAEVIGLMMCKILDINEEAYKGAKMLGRSMQYCNFIRDIKEDNELGRRYLPTDEINKYGLEGLEEEQVEKEKFENFMRAQIGKYWEWQREAEKGLKHLPYRVRVPVILSSRLYKWTARRIEEDPMIVYRKEVRPSKLRIFYELLASLKGRK